MPKVTHWSNCVEVAAGPATGVPKASVGGVLALQAQPPAANVPAAKAQ